MREPSGACFVQLFVRSGRAQLMCSPKLRACWQVPQASHLVPCSPQPSVVGRVANLPLISSTCGMVSAAYTSTKESYPHVRTVCDVAEKGVKTLTTAAVSRAQPILSKLEPQSELKTPRCGERRSWPSLEEIIPTSDLQFPGTSPGLLPKPLKGIYSECVFSPCSCDSQQVCTPRAG